MILGTSLKTDMSAAGVCWVSNFEKGSVVLFIVIYEISHRSHDYCLDM